VVSGFFKEFGMGGHGEGMIIIIEINRLSVNIISGIALERVYSPD